MNSSQFPYWPLSSFPASDSSAPSYQKIFSGLSALFHNPDDNSLLLDPVTKPIILPKTS